MSLIKASSALLDWLTISRYCRCSVVGSRSMSSSLMPMIQFMGVRISWLMLARNSLLARLLAWASRMACIRLFSASSLVQVVMN